MRVVSLQSLMNILVLIGLLFHCSTAAQDNQYSVELLDENDGFNTSIVFSIVQDQQGFLWFGTAYDGVMRFDGKNVVNFRRDTLSQYKLKHNDSGNLLLDSAGKIWIGGWGSSISVLDPVTNATYYYMHDQDDPTTVSSEYVQSLMEDDSGFLWFGTRSAGLNRFNPATNQFERFAYDQAVTSSPGVGTSHGRIWSLFQDKQQAIWIGTEYGLNRLDPQTGEFEYFLPDPDLGATGKNKIRKVEYFSDTELLLGTHDGILIFDIETGRFRTINEANNSVIGPIFSLIKTYFDQYWVTTRRGVYYFTKDNPVLQKVPLNIDDSCALTLFQDKQNIIWMSCEGRGIYKIVPQTFFKTFNYPVAKSAYSLTMSNDGNVLIGTEAEGVQVWDWQNNRLYPFSSNTIKDHPSVNRIVQDMQGNIWFTDSHYLYQIKSDGSLHKITPPPGTQHTDKFKDIYHITHADDGGIWLGTERGVFVIESVDRPFKYYGDDESDPSSLSTPNVAEIYQDSQGRIWLGTLSGLSLWLPETDSFQHFYAAGTNNEDVSNTKIYSIHEDEKGQIWAGSQIGLLYLDKDSEQLIAKGSGDFTGGIGVRFIKGDKAGNLWLVTQVGVFKYNPLTDTLQEFDERDGLSDARYFINLATQSSNGTIFISSRNGIHYFDPLLIKDEELDIKTVLTNFEVLGASHTSHNQLSNGTPITLAPNENYIRFDFSALDMLNARQIRYRYMLEGLDEQWIDNGTSNSVIYTNLKGGDYRFKVSPVLKNNLVYEEELIVDLHISTPLWRQTWMLVVYVIVLILLVSVYIRRRQVRHNREIVQQKRFVSELETQVAIKTSQIQNESEKLAAANRVKSQFLANMSHEIRTPLTAIIGLSESIIQGDVNKQEVTSEVGRIHKQSRHLLSLLNDILDVTKIEENKYELEPYELDFRALLSEVNDMFVSQAKEKNLEFNIVSQLPSRFIVFVDGLRLKQVLINLISNALKFTLKGQVTVLVSQQESRLLFNVVDTGIGMTAEQLNNVFDMFTQADSSINRRFGGSGLGLALSQKLVAMMGGELQVSSEPNKGSSFTFSVPVEIINSDIFNYDLSGKAETLPRLQGTVLLAEDQPDNRRFIRRLLERLGLNVVTANDGIEAISQYKICQPQLILLDIQMPEKDGIQTFKELRELGAKQPIVAITANAMSHDIEQYKRLGFNDYLTKPLSRKQLTDLISLYLEPNIDTHEVEEALKSVDFGDLRTEFVARLASEIEEFEAASDSPEKIDALAHRLSGAAQLLGFKDLAEQALELQRATQKTPDVLHQRLRALVQSMQQLQESAEV